MARPRASFVARRTNNRPSDGPAITEPTRDELTEVAGRILELKARDLAAKRSGNFAERPNLGRMIFELMRALAAARGG